MQLPDNTVSYFIGDDGKLHVYFDTDVVFHYQKGKQEIVNEVSVEFSQYKIEATALSHHTNPYYSKALEDAIGNREITESIKYKTAKYYRAPGRPDYKRIGKERMFNNRLKNAGCGCNGH